MEMATSSIKVILVGDIHYGPNSEFRPGKEIPGLMDRFVDVLNTELHPDAVVELGDRINNVDPAVDGRNLACLADMLDHRLTAPCYHVLGNHDVHNIEKSESSRILGSEVRPNSRMIKGFKFIFIDTVDPMIEGIGGRVGGEQLRWLEHEAGCDDLPKLVFGHHPIDDHAMRGNTTFTRIPHLNFVENGKDVRRILENGRNFILYANGHTHWFSFLCGGKGTYVVAPSFTEAYPERVNAPGMFLEADIYGDGKVEAAVHTINPRRVLGRFTSRG